MRNLQTITKAVFCLGMAFCCINGLLADGEEPPEVFSQGGVSWTDPSIVARTMVGGRTLLIASNLTAAAAITAERTVTLYRALLVGGGGGGGSTIGGGGGGGGVTEWRDANLVLQAGNVLSLAVGKGGIGGGRAGNTPSQWPRGTNGGATTLTLLDGDWSLTALGGGGGGAWNQTSANGGLTVANPGGPCHGAARPAVGTSGYLSGTSSGESPGGGAGAGGNGGNGVNSGAAGDGGIGHRSDITGEYAYYGGGGAGSGGNSCTTGGIGGLGGGANGVNKSVKAADTLKDGVNGLGGGGAGGSHDQSNNGGNGGCGCVILAFAEGDSRINQFVVEPIPSQDGSAGYDVRPSPVVRNMKTGEVLAADVDYEVIYAGADRIGQTSLTVKGLAQYENYDLTVPFEITATRFEDDFIAVDVPVAQMRVSGGLHVYTITNAAVDVNVRRPVTLVGAVVVGGGGAGGNTMGGGGGGGGVRVEGSLGDFLDEAEIVRIVCGAGGTAGGSGQEAGKDGSPTTLAFGSRVLDALGGGGGGGWSSTAGHKGGSGGGGAQTGAGGAGAEGLGFAGAKGGSTGAAAGGGGGGAGGPGSTSANSRAGNGGPGYEDPFSGLIFGGGGGAGGTASGFGNYQYGYGGAGGGANGSNGGTGGHGVDGLGGGGGGGGWTGGNQKGGAGGSGAVVLVLRQCDFRASQVQDQTWVPEGCWPKPVVTDLDGHVLAEGTAGGDEKDYVLEYKDNLAPGYATVTAVGKGEFAGTEVPISFLISRRIYTRTTVAEEGEGTGWDDALSLSNALAVASASAGPCEIWLAADGPILTPYAMTLSAPLKIRGGFAGNEATPEDRAEGALTTFDGKTTVTCILTVDNAENAGLTLERIKICRAKANGLIKNGKGGLALHDCEISGNGLGSNSVYGRGMKVNGGGVGTLVVSNCVYAGNRYTTNADNNYGGFGIYAASFASATIDDTLFVTNGFKLSSPGGSSWIGYYTRGAAIDMVDTPTTIRSTRFAGNCCPMRTSNVNGDWGGGTVFLQGKCGGSRLEHCQFVGNTDVLSYQGNAVAYSGALSVYLSAKTDKVSVRSCTFAYNVTQGSQSGGGITVGQGDVDVENSIFWRNERTYVTTLGYGRDIQVHGNGTLHLAHSLVTTLDGTALAGAGLTYDGQTVCAFDPKLVTTTSLFESLVEASASSFYYKTTSLAALADMDCHLLSSAGYFLNGGAVGPATEDYSSAIDRGNPASDCSREPSPNGGNINLGAFGNTPEASKTSVGQPCATVEMTYPDGMARPASRVTMGIAEGTDYSASLHLVCSTNGVTVFEKVYDNVKKTDVFEDMLPFYVPVGQVVTVTAFISARGATNAAYSASEPATGGVPAFFGKGGGRHVIHVRQGADCKMDGSSWTDAYPDLVSAFKSAPDADKAEVWLSVTNDYLPTTATLSYPLTIRGGFAGVENSETDRVAGVMSVLSANNLFKNLELNNAAGTLLTIERIWATKSAGSGIKKGGAGDLLVRDCRFEGLNYSGAANGRGIYAAGGNVAVTNCVFANNVGPNENGGNGYGIYLSACARAAVDDCLFVSNGYNFASAAGTWYSKIRGVGIFADATPTVIRNCRFAANCTPQREANDGGVVYFNGACGGSAMTNCVLVGNGEIYSYQCGNPSGHNGALVVCMSKATDTLDVKNCTIAYNLTHGASAPGGVHVRQGDVRISDSIVFGNVRGNRSLTGFGADVHVAGGSCFMTYCTVTALDDSSLSGVGLTLDDTGTVRAADPCFVTSRDEYLSLLDDTGNWINCKAANRARHAAIDVHLLSPEGYVVNGGSPGPATNVYSPCIDTGSPWADYAAEPEPNGENVNQGAYGNTPEASLSSVGQPMIVNGEVTFPDGMRRPHFVLKLCIKSGSDFSANVDLVCKTGEVTVAESKYSGQSKTSVIDWTLPFFAEAGGEVKVTATVMAKGAETLVETFAGVAVGDVPDYFGKGGGAHVIHVRPGADCRMNGRDWTDAYPTLQAALSGGIPADKTEIWMAVSNDCFTTTLSVTNAVRMLGGFTGTENAPEERPEGTYAKLDGQYVYKTLAVSVGAGASLELERVIFTRSTSCALKKTGAGDLVVRDCQFVNNQAGGRIDGRGLYVSGGRATVTNCQFRLNRGGTELPGFGCGIHLTDCVNVFVDDCHFSTNGGGFGSCQGTWSGQYNGSAAYVNNTPAVFRNCRFTAHGSGQRLTTDGGAVYFCGKSGGSALTNCTLVGNSDFLSYQNNTTGTAGGALVCAMSSQSAVLDVCNCTIAYNLTQGQYASAGINVMSGTVNVRNSIVFGNVRGRRTSQDAGADIDVKSGATANLDYTLLTATNMPSVSSSGTLNLSPTCFAADPLFVSATNDFQSLLSGDANWWNLASGKEGACAALNVHLRGHGGYFDENTGARVRYRDVTSPALDAGDPASSYAREPDLRSVGGNGKRVNLGAYGNTPWATMTRVKGAFLSVR